MAPSVHHPARVDAVKRQHGKSRLERLLEASIRQELQIKAMRQMLLELSVRLATVERR